MRKISLLDCTLRDGGYINDWRFGKETIKGFSQKIAQTGIEFFEVGFLKGNEYNPDRSVFPDADNVIDWIAPKSQSLRYVGMLDMSNPIPLERLRPCDARSLDGIRVIFKKDKLDEAYTYCKRIKELGYLLFVNFVGTDMYSDEEFIAGIKRFNNLMPYAMAIVDSFGLIKRKQFLRLVYIADNNMHPDIALCYHAHNNLQQALGNAEAMVELNLKRDICFDACVFGMGRGAGNLNLELFAGYMNENYDTQYRIEPMLEIIDEYLQDIYRRKPWGYSLPLYLSATTGCHPNYAIHIAEKDTLTVKSFYEFLRGIPEEHKAKFTKELAEKYYSEHQDIYIDDTKTLALLEQELGNKKILLIAPGRSLQQHETALKEKIRLDGYTVIALNFAGGGLPTDYIFSSNLRRYAKIEIENHTPLIITSNVSTDNQHAYIVNYSSYTSSRSEIVDNSGLMALRLLMRIGVKEVAIAGMDGYNPMFISDYLDSALEYHFEQAAELRNQLISDELKDIAKYLELHFLTPTRYKI